MRGRDLYQRDCAGCHEPQSTAITTRGIKTMGATKLGDGRLAIEIFANVTQAAMTSSSL
jgi:hypothetical protein